MGALVPQRVAMGLALALARLNDGLIYGSAPEGGVPVGKWVNMHKGLVGLFAYGILKLLGVNVATNPVASLYVALHGGYGFMWLAKDIAYPDAAWQVPTTLAGGLMTFVFLSTAYLLSPWCIGLSTPTLSAQRMALTVGAYTAGVFLHFGSDCQKFYTLRYKANRELITEGFFAYTRNPNYLGEILIYGSFASLSGSWIPWVSHSIVWCILFYPNMVKKDARLSRYANFGEYCKRAWMLVPNPACLRHVPGALLPWPAPGRRDVKG